MATRQQQNPKTPPIGTTKKLAVSYQRVSTKAQTEDGRSGFARQEAALQGWLQKHPDYELDHRLTDAGISGGGKHRQKGALGWFLQQGREGHWAPGTCLVVETFSRFSREPISDTLKVLLELWDLGLTISFCDWGGEVLTSLEQNAGTIYQVVGANDQAHRELQEKRARAKGAAAHKKALIAQGEKPFLPRTKGKARTAYPFWLDFDPKLEQFVLNAHAVWLRDVFLWAQEIGSLAIAKRLREKGIRCVTDRRKAISAPAIVKLLANPAVTGHKQHMEGFTPVGELVPGVFPPIVTEEEWRLTREAVKRRHAGQGAVASPRLHNLFEGRVFCTHCGGRIGLVQNKSQLADGSTKVFSYLRCMTHQNDPTSCPAKRKPYDELRILQRFQAFRWADYFSDAKHEQEITAARNALLQAQAAKADRMRELENLKAAFIEQARQGNPLLAGALEAELSKLQAGFNEAEADANAAQGALDALQRRRTGKDAQRIIQARIEGFLRADRTDVDTRQEFNRWLFQEGLVVAFDLITDRFELGTGTVTPLGRLEELDQRLEAAAAFGMDLDVVRADLEARDRAIAEQLGAASKRIGAT